MPITTFSKIIAGTMSWGVWGKKLTTNEMTSLIHHCLEQNITTFDHADIYGDYSTEQEFGKAFNQSGVIREKLQFISKCGIELKGQARAYNKIKHYNYSKHYIINSAEQSLKKLQCDYLDLLLLHRPSPLMQADVIADAFLELKQQGKVKAFGVSNFSPLQIELIQSETDIVANQIEFSLPYHEAMNHGVLDYLTTHKIKAMAWAPLGKIDNNTAKSQLLISKLLPLTEKYQATTEQLLLAWILKHPANISPVVGTTNFRRMVEVNNAEKINLDLQDWFLMWEASLGHEVP